MNLCWAHAVLWNVWILVEGFRSVVHSIAVSLDKTSALRWESLGKMKSSVTAKRFSIQYSYDCFYRIIDDLIILTGFQSLKITYLHRKN